MSTDDNRHSLGTLPSPLPGKQRCAPSARLVFLPERESDASPVHCVTYSACLPGRSSAVGPSWRTLFDSSGRASATNGSVQPMIRKGHRTAALTKCRRPTFPLAAGRVSPFGNQQSVDAATTCPHPVRRPRSPAAERRPGNLDAVCLPAARSAGSCSRHRCWGSPACRFLRLELKPAVVR